MLFFPKLEMRILNAMYFQLVRHCSGCSGVMKFPEVYQEINTRQSIVSGLNANRSFFFWFPSFL